MSAVYVIHKAEDRSVVETAVLCPLPALGFDAWLSAPLLEELDDAELFAEAVENCPAILAVVSRGADTSARFRRQIDQALASGTPCIPIYVGVTPEGVALPGLATRQAITIGSAADLPAVQALWRTLASQLPESVASTESAARLSTVALPIEWNAQAFSYLLATAMGRQDFSRGEVLVRAFSRHNAGRSTPYDTDATKTDLDALRKKRQFLLIRDYASAVLRLSPDNFRVRRQLGQALIELGELDPAEGVLRQLVRDAPPTHDESFEARGLLGRINKQRYVNGLDPAAAQPSILAAIDAYRSVFAEANKHTWHGVNAASLILRAARDGIAGPPPDEARQIAEATLKVLSDRQEATARENLADPEKAKQREGAELFVWDYASRVEALIDLGRFAEAGKALDDYLDHPGMDAFEVASTFRQFDEVLQLSKTNEGGPLLERLRKAAERFRTGGLTQPDAGQAPRAMLVRVSNPDWRPTNIPDLEVRTHFGTVLSILGSDATVRALLKETVVLGIEESRPAFEYECVDSLPFINAIHQDLKERDYSENGEHAMVAIIDDGIDVLHEAFLDDDKRSRIVGIWDQRDNAGPAPAGFTFGTYYSRDQIDGFVKAKSVPASLGRNKDGHGTHVASIAAGCAAGKFAAGGVAPAAKLLVVISSSDQPTGYSDAHIAGLKFIDQAAKEAKDGGMPVVVNVSQGMNAGAHDGRSALELGFEHFSDGGRMPGRVVVKSAGNERDRSGHAEVSLLGGAVEFLDWECDPAQFARPRFELWWRSSNRFSFRLLEPQPSTQWRKAVPEGAPPRGASAVVDRSNPEVEGRFRGRGSYRMSFVHRHPDNGDSVLKVDVSNGMSQIASVFWTLEITAQRVSEQGDIHAWIERDGPPTSRFLNHSNEKMTLTVPGTAYSVITVGAIVPKDPIMVGIASSYGPTRDDRRKPELVAPGIGIRAARGDTADDVIVMSGTSMAAPHVAGAVALVLSKVARAGRTTPSATQISAAIRETTKNYSGVHDRGQGYGVLNVKALLDEF
jgi:subtilisin family serine protease